MYWDHLSKTFLYFLLKVWIAVSCLILLDPLISFISWLLPSFDSYLCGILARILMSSPCWLSYSWYSVRIPLIENPQRGVNSFTLFLSLLVYFYKSKGNWTLASVLFSNQSDYKYGYNLNTLTFTYRQILKLWKVNVAQFLHRFNIISPKTQCCQVRKHHLLNVVQDGRMPIVI